MRPNMDFKTFSSDDFDPKEWINNVWNVASQQESKEIFISSTVNKLQSFTKQLSAALDDTTVQVVRVIPQILQEAQSLSQDGAMLKEKLLCLEQRARAVEEDTEHSIESLRRIDKLKSSLQAACQALREADKWAQLATTLEEQLDAGVPVRGKPVTTLTEQVAAMTASLQVLSDSPDYEKKKVQLEVLYNRLEAALSPAIVEALAQKDAESAKLFGGLLTAMGRPEACAGYWRRVEAASLEAEWRRRGETGAPPADLLAELPAVLLHHANDQLDWLRNVIGARLPQSELVRLYAELLPGLEPAPTKLASAALRHCAVAADALNLLVDMRSTLDAFVESIRALIDNAKVPLSEVSEPLRELCVALHAPLRALLPQYTELQTQALTDQMSTVDYRQEDPLDAARALQQCAERCEGWARAAEATGRKIAGLACYPYLVPALEALFASLCSLVSGRLRMLSAEASAGGAWRALPAALATAAAGGAMLVRARAVGCVLASGCAITDSSEDLLSSERYLLLEESRAWLSRARSSSGTPLEGAAGDAARLCRALAQLVLQCLCAAPSSQLDKVPELTIWSDNDQFAADLPDFSIAPQEYITQVGQYLMTLPQHLEPHLAQQSDALAAALAPDRDVAVYLINQVCTQICELYAEKLCTIRKMDTLGKKRCAVDIAYLSSVVEELGGTVPPALKNYEKSLGCAKSSSDDISSKLI